MKPKRIILVRHGESEGNADMSQRKTTPDYKLNLTPKGCEQALQAGRDIRALIDDEHVQVYGSPYYRTRQTYEKIRESIGANVTKISEDPRIREQDWGHLRAPDENKEIEDERDAFGPFYFRIPDGESGADVYDRVSTFFETLHRDFKKENYPPNVLIVTHGMTLRLFLMRWFHWTVEEFDDLRNPENCQIVVMQLGLNGKYELKSELARRSDQT